MARTWVLDSDAKGTGAEMVPLERALERKRSAPKRERSIVGRRPSTRRRQDAESAKAPEPRLPARFKVVDVVSRRVLAEGAGTRETVDVLRDVRSVVDVHLYLWEPDAERWRALTLREQRLVWGFRERRRAGGHAAAEAEPSR